MLFWPQQFPLHGRSSAGALLQHARRPTARRVPAQRPISFIFACETTRWHTLHRPADLRADIQSRQPPIAGRETPGPPWRWQAVADAPPTWDIAGLLTRSPIMAKEELIEMQGTVTEVLPDGRYRVTLENDHTLIAYEIGRAHV